MLLNGAGSWYIRREDTGKSEQRSAGKYEQHQAYVLDHK